MQLARATPSTAKASDRNKCRGPPVALLGLRLHYDFPSPPWVESVGQASKNELHRVALQVPVTGWPEVEFGMPLDCLPYRSLPR